MTLREKQTLFLDCLAKLIRYAHSVERVKLTLGEGRIANPRKVYYPKGALPRVTTIAEDAVHMRGSLHYLGLAQDLNLFVDDEYITDGQHSMWKALGEYWESLHPLCRWGGRFGGDGEEFTGKDSNHFSLEHGGRA